MFEPLPVMSPGDRGVGAGNERVVQPLSRCPSFFLGVQVFKVPGHLRDVCGERREKRSAHKPPAKRSGATRQGGVRDTKSTRGKTSAGISPFLKFETSPLLRKKLQMGNTETQAKPRGGKGRAGAAPHWDGAHRAGPHEHSRIRSICLHGGFGEFLCLGTWRRAGHCLSCSSHPAQAPSAQGGFPRPGTLERASLTGLPGQQNQLVSTTAQNCLKRKKSVTNKQTKKESNKPAAAAQPRP